MDDILQEQKKRHEEYYKLLDISKIEIHLAENLAYLGDKKEENNLLNKIGIMREKFKNELGKILPPIRIKTSKSLQKNEYEVFLTTQKVFTGTFKSLDNIELILKNNIERWS